jgi:hypothetical protein
MVRGSNSPPSSATRRDNDCEKARVWGGEVTNATRRGIRPAVKGLAE